LRVEARTIGVPEAREVEDLLVAERAGDLRLADARTQHPRDLLPKAGEGRERGTTALLAAHADRQHDEAEQVPPEETPGADVLPDERDQVLLEEALDLRLAPAASGRPAVLVVHAAPRLEHRRPAALPSAVAEVDVLDVHRREDRLVEAAEREEA